ncbi:retinol dehydrogenase 16-like [Melopsittacus undulatus]|uniref:Uncharacterized protein n=1 Tax=Melopsittacus undulatus TaxID=13146 RepID=A0A8C6J8N2_MELUD|nr:retinol dehydrogenase 16-like [Melopsittacus undulatus]
MWVYALAALAALLLLRRWYRERQTVPGLPERFVLITGCDSGFGQRLALRLDALGLPVLAACQSPDGAERLRAAASQRLQTLILDVTSSPSIAAAAAWVKERVGDRGLWGLVNNAGVAVPAAPNEWLSKDDFLKVINVNLIGLIEVTLSVLPLVRRAQGRVVNVSSVMGRVSFFGGGYCISKFGVEAFSDSLRLDMRSFGVKVSVIEPGYFQTNITNAENIQKHFMAIWEKLPEDIKADYGEGYLKHFLESFRNMKNLCSPNLSLVTDCMEHALTSRYPRTRYAAGWDAKLLYIPLSYAPSALTDWVFAKHQPPPARRA